MTYLSEAHTEWHTIHGWDQGCPLDCFDPYEGWWTCDCGSSYGPSESCPRIACAMLDGIDALLYALDREDAEARIPASDPWAIDPPF